MSTITFLLRAHDVASFEGKPSTEVKRLLAVAFAHNLNPVTPPLGRKKVTVRFNKNQNHLIERQGERLKPKRLLGLVHAAINFELKEKYNDDLPATSSSDNGTMVRFLGDRQFRPEQEKMIPALKRALHSNKIAMLEASTGSGKGAALLAAGIEDGRPALVVAPTISIIKQLIDEFKHFDVDHSYAVIIGRRNFMSSTLLFSAMQALREEKPTNSQAILELFHWIKQQEEGKSDPVFNSTWIMEDCVKICPSVPLGLIEACTLDHLPAGKKYVDLRNNDQGEQAYRENRAKAQSVNKARLVFTTHTMLAVDAVYRYREGMNEEERARVNAILSDNALLETTANLQDVKPAVLKATIISESQRRMAIGSRGFFGNRILLIDEAHLLERNIANFLSENLSLFTVLNSVKKDLQTHDKVCAKKCKPLVEKLQAHFDELVEEGQDKDMLSHLNLADPSLAVMSDIMIQFAKTLTAYIKTSDSDDPIIIQANKVLRSLFDTKKKGVSAFISLSPSYRYPSLIIGPTYIHKYLNTLWGAYPASALVSATLSVPGRGYDFVRNQLCIPTSSFMQCDAVETSWIKKNMTVHLPHKGVGDLIRPKCTEPQHVWLEEVTDYIELITQSARGGTLVLTSSYDIITNIDSLVGGDTARRLIVQGQTSYEDNIKDFKEKDRPIWLATGRSWTGLNLVDDNNKELFTDLIIVNLPFSLSGSASSINRIKSKGFHNVVPYELAIQLKQGVGRPKRDDDDTQRHIWFLDNRAVNGRNANAIHYKIPMMVFDDYPIEHFDRETLKPTPLQ